MERFWASSAQTAQVSAELAKRLRCVRPDIAYTFGLFPRLRHSAAGQSVFRKPRRQLAKANVAEDRLFSMSRMPGWAPIMRWSAISLARRWHLADFIAEAVLHHHDYSVLAGRTAFGDSTYALIALVVLAEHIARIHNTGDGEEQWGKAA